ncbi:MAG: hypothetical protein NZ874_01810, partial [Fimbriimonadales bacterium]|nr:hypothetical protein [Fimbriimonadales bacterium]
MKELFHTRGANCVYFRGECPNADSERILPAAAGGISLPYYYTTIRGRFGFLRGNLHAVRQHRRRIFQEEEYHHDALGRIERKEEHLPNAQANLRKVAEVRYTYDHQAQLIAEQRTGQHAYTIRYTYDKVGNRLTRTRTINGQTTEDRMVYNAANQLTSLNGQSWTHDADGNVTVRRVNGETWLLEYDAEGNLTSLRRQGASVGWQYTYDGLGRRVRAQLGSHTLE